MGPARGKESPSLRMLLLCVLSGVRHTVAAVMGSSDEAAMGGLVWAAESSGDWARQSEGDRVAVVRRACGWGPVLLAESGGTARWWVTPFGELPLDPPVDVVAGRVYRPVLVDGSFG